MITGRQANNDMLRGWWWWWWWWCQDDLARISQKTEIRVFFKVNDGWAVKI